MSVRESDIPKVHSHPLTESTTSQYTDEQRREVVTLWAIHGQDTKVSEVTGIPCRTINGWRNGSEWWESALAEIRQEISERHISMYHRITDAALGKALDGIDTLKPGDLKAADVKSLVVGAATATDKARLILNQPTSIRADSGGVSALMAQFAELSKQWDEKQANVVSTQSGKIETDGE